MAASNKLPKDLLSCLVCVAATHNTWVCCLHGI